MKIHDNADRHVIEALKGVIAVSAILLVCGCVSSYTLEEARALISPYCTDVNDLDLASIQEPTIDPLTAEWLIGQWIGEGKSMGGATGRGSSVSRFEYEVTFSYVFKPDGTFCFTSTDTHVSDSPMPFPKARKGADGKWRYSGDRPNYIGNGTWRYSNGNLDLVESGKWMSYGDFSTAIRGDYGRARELGSCKDVARHLLVYWKSEDEIAVRYRTPQDLLAAQTDVLAQRTGKTPDKSWCGYDKNDGGEVFQAFWLHPGSTKGGLSFTKTKVSNLRRVSGRERENAPVSGKFR